MRRRCSKLWRLTILRRSEYGIFFNPGRRFVKFCWTFSRKSIWVIFEGDQVVEAYSNVGLTKVVKALAMSGMLRERKQRSICEERILERETIECIWLMKLSLGSMRIPRSLTVFDWLIGESWNSYWCCCLLWPRWRIVHLVNDMGNGQVLDQFNMISSWCCKSIEFEVEMLVYNLRSSANNLAVMVSSSESTLYWISLHVNKMFEENNIKSKIRVSK